MESTEAVQKIWRIFAEVLPEKEIGTDVLKEVLITLGASKDDADAVLHRFNGPSVCVRDFLNFILPEAVQAEFEVTKYDLHKMPGLLAYCRDADVRLVRPDYLRELHRSGQTLPRRQEAEHARTADGRTALLTQEELEQMASTGDWRDFTVFALSHVWESREHPDPAAYQLKVLVEALDDFPQIQQTLYPGIELAQTWQAGVFIDYASLYQFGARTKDQEAAFRRAMQHMHVLYCHDESFTLRIKTLTPGLHTATGPAPEVAQRKVRAWSVPQDAVVDVPLHQLRLTDDKGRCSDSCDWPPKKDHDLQCPQLHGNSTPYDSRGWCVAETQWSLAREGTWKTITIPFQPGTASMAPIVPEDFRAVAAENLRFTHRSDEGTVVRLQGEVFHAKTAEAEGLYLGELPADQVKVLSRALGYYHQLRKLEVCRSEVKGEAAEALASAVQHMTALQDLCLGQNAMGDAGAEALGAALQHGTALQTLWLWGNSIGARGLKALAAALQHHTGMRMLDMSANGFGDAGAKALASAVQHMPALQKLRLAKNAIGDAGAEALGAALQHGTALQTLWLFENSIGARGLEALAGALQRHTAMRELVLSSNRFGDAGAKALASAVQHMPALQDLRLQQNAIGDAGAEALAAALRHGAALQILCLHQNAIGDKGDQALSTALVRHVGLRELGLHGNVIGDAGAKALLPTLRQLSALQAFTFYENRISEALRQEVREAVQDHPQLTRLLL